MHMDENDTACPSTKDAEDRTGGESSGPFPGPAAPAPTPAPAAPLRKPPAHDTETGARRGELIRILRETAADHGDALSREEFSRLSGVGSSRIYRAFDSWRELCSLAGVSPKRSYLRLSDDQIFSAMRNALLEIGRVPSRKVFQRHFKYSPAVFNSRGMNWKEALYAFRHWAMRNAPDFPYMDSLPECATPTGPAPRSWRPLGQETLGEMIAFRAMAHAPVNEQGVVLLFGMVAAELGYIVETVRIAFPDCLAKRQVNGGRWQRVRVEFEYRSRSFRDHGHDAAGCDVIVCWRHDWPDCPLEVLELSNAIGGLAG